MAEQVGEEDEGPDEDADEQRLLAFIVVGDSPAELPDAGLDGRFGDQDLLDVLEQDRPPARVMWQGPRPDAGR